MQQRIRTARETAPQPQTFYLPKSMGWGNVALSLYDLVHRSSKPRVYTSLLDVDRGVS